MREGMYGVEFQAVEGRSKGSIVLQGGRIFGVDEGGALYDGDYAPEEGGRTKLRIKVSMPPNVKSVLGASSPEGWSIDLEASADLPAGEGRVRMDTPLGVAIETFYRFLRPITPKG